MSRAKFGPIVQLGLVVDDLDASVQRWIDMMGVGPWIVFRNVVMNGHYQGQATAVGIDVALSYQGDVQIELIAPTNAAPSPYRGADGAPRIGLHHLAWLTDDLDATISGAEADGLKSVFRAENPGTRVAYLAAPGEAGLLFEFIESAATRQLIVDGLAATRAWDGSNPIHVIDFAAQAGA